MPTEVSVSVGSDYLENAIVNGEEGHVKGPSTKVKHEDVLFSLALVQPVGNGSCSPGQQQKVQAGGHLMSITR